MPTIFIALQCYQCSTMQVKQKKKSSNKWICVVCNEKQSVRKVFFEGYLAKDVRKFVQNFNMSRQCTEENRNETLISPSKVIDDQWQTGTSYQRKRRSDWSEFLNPVIEDEYEREQHQGGSEFEPEIVTELPKDMFKKPKVKSYSAGLKKTEGVKCFNPISSEEKNSIPFIAQGMGKLCSGKVACDDIFAANKTVRKLQTESAQRSSKWTEYLTLDDDDDFLFKGAEDLPDILPQWVLGVSDIQFNDRRVEEDVHPDFI